jgi:hypothetical protein
MLCRPLFLLLYEILKLTWTTWILTDEGMCYLQMCLHLIIASALLQDDSSRYETYRRKTRWKTKLKKIGDKVFNRIINVTGEQMYKIINLLPNYKTRHKFKRR